MLDFFFILRDAHCVISILFAKADKCVASWIWSIPVVSNNSHLSFVIQVALDLLRLWALVMSQIALLTAVYASSFSWNLSSTQFPGLFWVSKQSGSRSGVCQMRQDFKK